MEIGSLYNNSKYHDVVVLIKGPIPCLDKRILCHKLVLMHKGGMTGCTDEIVVQKHQQETLEAIKYLYDVADDFDAKRVVIGAMNIGLKNIVTQLTPLLGCQDVINILSQLDHDDRVKITLRLSHDYIDAIIPALTPEDIVEVIPELAPCTVAKVVPLLTQPSLDLVAAHLTCGHIMYMILDNTPLPEEVWPIIIHKINADSDQNKVACDLILCVQPEQARLILGYGQTSGVVDAVLSIKAGCDMYTVVRKLHQSQCANEQTRAAIIEALPEQERDTIRGILGW